MDFSPTLNSTAVTRFHLVQIAENADRSCVPKITISIIIGKH